MIPLLMALLAVLGIGLVVIVGWLVRRDLKDAKLRARDGSRR